MMYEKETLFVVPEHIQTRWASLENMDGEKGLGGKANKSRKGSPSIVLKAGEQRVLAHAENTSGTIRRIWMTIIDRRPVMLRGIRIDIFWDGENNPAVSAPLGDFFGQGLGRCVTFESALFSNPEGRSFNCIIPMPFRTGMKIVITNESENDLQALYYDIDYTLGDRHDSDVMYFHAYWNREQVTSLKQDYEFLPQITGRGRYLGVNIGVIPDTQTYFKTWWGEGECKIYLDGDREYPTLCGTGTEDYIGTGWGQGAYAHRYQGCHLADEENFQFAFYRYHVPDPVYFQQDIRVTMQQIGGWGPENSWQLRDAKRNLVGINGLPVDLDKAVADNWYGLFERQDDWSSCAYFYLDQPVNKLPPLAAVQYRTAGLLDIQNVSS